MDAEDAGRQDSPLITPMTLIHTGRSKYMLGDQAQPQRTPRITKWNLILPFDRLQLIDGVILQPEFPPLCHRERYEEVDHSGCALPLLFAQQHSAPSRHEHAAEDQEHFWVV